LSEEKVYSSYKEMTNDPEARNKIAQALLEKMEKDGFPKMINSNGVLIPEWLMKKYEKLGC
jgi:isopenicillin N synthase-like dioxygenase